MDIQFPLTALDSKILPVILRGSNSWPSNLSSHFCIALQHYHHGDHQHAEQMGARSTSEPALPTPDLGQYYHPGSSFSRTLWINTRFQKKKKKRRIRAETRVRMSFPWSSNAKPHSQMATAQKERLKFAELTYQGCIRKDLCVYDTHPGVFGINIALVLGLFCLASKINSNIICPEILQGRISKSFRNNNIWGGRFQVHELHIAHMGLFVSSKLQDSLWWYLALNSIMLDG